MELQAGFSGLDAFSEDVGLHDQGAGLALMELVVGFAGLSADVVLRIVDEMTPMDPLGWNAAIDA